MITKRVEVAFSLIAILFTLFFILNGNVLFPNSFEKRNTGDDLVGSGNEIQINDQAIFEGELQKYDGEYFTFHYPEDWKYWLRGTDAFLEFAEVHSMSTEEFNVGKLGSHILVYVEKKPQATLAELKLKKVELAKEKADDFVISWDVEDSIVKNNPAIVITSLSKESIVTHYEQPAELVKEVVFDRDDTRFVIRYVSYAKNQTMLEIASQDLSVFNLIVDTIKNNN